MADKEIFKKVKEIYLKSREMDKETLNDYLRLLYMQRWKQHNRSEDCTAAQIFWAYEMVLNVTLALHVYTTKVSLHYWHTKTKF